MPRWCSPFALKLDTTMTGGVGHLNFEALRQLGAKEMVRGMPHIDQVEQICDTCVLTKQRRLLFPHQASYCAQ